MPKPGDTVQRYFFDFSDGVQITDDEGIQLPSFEAVRRMAMEALPRIAADEIPIDGDKQVYVVVVRDETGHAVYTATLSYVGLQLPVP